MNYREIVNARRLAFGPEDRLMTMAQIKYPWAIEIYEHMEANTWFPKSIGMGTDKDQYTSLDPKMRRAYDLALGFVSNLDGIQFNNLIHNIGAVVTAPEVSLALARQAAEEGVHVRAYQTMIEAVSLDPVAVYMLFQTDNLLAVKNEHIMTNSDVLKSAPNPHNFARAIISNVLLEGVYFYSAFLVFYVLARNGKMLQSADMIRYIQRDEGGTHLELFAAMHKTFKLENPEVYDVEFYADATELIRDAVDLEIAWGQHIVGDGLQGLTKKVVENFVKWLADSRAEMLGLPKLYNVANPVPWFDDFSRPNGARQNFFERKPTDYSVDGLEW
jgi:ribonucleoside-diphosphate reductase beta chain